MKFKDIKEILMEEESKKELSISDIRKEIEESSSFNFDKVSLSKGVITVKQSYFYRHGGSPEKIADKLKSKYPQIKIIDTEDKWASWPKTSYFVVKFSL